MKRKAFILTEILTGMLLQTLFALTLCGAFYLILTFSTSTQQILAAHDQGQMIISYIDNRIRNAGVGLHNCETPAGVAAAFDVENNMTVLVVDHKPLPLPIAISSQIGTGREVISSDDKVYEGNILVLLHAHKDNTYQAEAKEELIVLGVHDTSPDLPTTLKTGTEQAFKFLPNVLNKDTNFNFGWSSASGNYKDIKSWAVMEASGVPVRVKRASNEDDSHKFRMIAKYKEATIYPMSELLNLECQRLYVKEDTPGSGRSFVFGNLEANGSYWKEYYHTKGILELYMTLDTKANPPIFDLKVLVSEGKNPTGELTERPSNWPAAYWQDGFAQYRVHVSQASWKLYNLAPLYHHD